MATVYDFVKIRNKRLELIASQPAIECPRCDKLCACVFVDEHETLTYICENGGHRKLTWRIDVEGNMLHGAKGKRYYS